MLKVTFNSFTDYEISYSTIDKNFNFSKNTGMPKVQSPAKTFCFWIQKLSKKHF